MSASVLYELNSMPELKRASPFGMSVSTTLHAAKENGIAGGHGGNGGDGGGGGSVHGAGKEWNFLTTLKNLKKWRRKGRSVKLTAEEQASRSPSEKSDVSSSSSGNQTVVDARELEVITFSVCSFLLCFIRERGSLRSLQNRQVRFLRRTPHVCRESHPVILSF